MTVVSFLDLNGKSGIASSDERGSFFLRSYDFFQKLYELRPGVVTGYAGSASCVNEVMDALKAKPAPGNYKEALAALKTTYKEVKREKIEDYVLERFQVSGSDIRKIVKEGKNEGIPKEIFDQMRSGNVFEAYFIIGGYDAEAGCFKMHSIAYPGGAEKETIYVTMGSGKDRAHRDIGDSIQKMRPEKRKNIEPYIGAKILVAATRSAWRNAGVGGSTQIALLGKENTRFLTRDQSNILTNSVFCEENGILDTQYVDDVFKKIVNDNAKPEELVSELQKQLTPETISRIFWTESLHI